MKRLAVAGVVWITVLRGVAGAQSLSVPRELPRAEETPQPSPTATPKRDSVLDGIGRGAAVGALAGLPLAIAQMKSCNTGCDWPSTGGMLIGWGILGAAAGASIGLAADLDTKGAPALGASPDQPAPRFYRAGLSPRVGLGLATTAPRTSALSGHSTGPALTVAVQLSPRISVHAEYLGVGTTFLAAPGAVPDEVLQNIVPASTRVAGFERGLASRRINYILTELVGMHPAPWGRVRLEFLGGIGVQGEEEHAYYDAYQPVPGRGDLPVAGKYYLLDFGSPEFGLVLGVDAEVAIAGGLRVVPTVRYRAMDDSSASLSYGAGVHWRF
jgi:hypothetical protein